MNTHPYQDEPEPTQVILMNSCNNGKMKALIDLLLDQSNERGIEATIRQPLPTRDEIAKTVWETSRADEGSVSFIGAHKIADAVLALILGCCGKCPPTATGIDCTCAGNPRCKGDTNE